MDLKAKIRERMASLEHEKKMAGIELNQDAIGNGNENTNAGDMQTVVGESAESAKLAKLKDVKQAIDENEGEKWPAAFTKFSVADWHIFDREMQSQVKSDWTEEEKFTHLLKACAGTDAEAVLARLVEKKFDVAFAKLKDTFGSAYAQVNFYTQALLKMPMVSKKNPSEYISMVHSVDYCMAGLKRHIDEQKFEKLIPSIVIGKFGHEIRVDWERYRAILTKSCSENANSPHKFLPDWHTIKIFLQDEAEFQAQFGNTCDTKPCDEKMAEEEKTFGKPISQAGMANIQKQHCD